MAEKTNRLKLPHLSRRAKAARNAILALLIAYLLWAAAGYPMTGTASLRRAERAYLLEPAAVLATVDTQANGPEFLIASGDMLEVFQLPEENLTASHESSLLLYKRAGEFTLVPLPSPIYGVSNGHFKGCMLVFGAPPSTASLAHLSFTVDGETYEAQADITGDGVLIFYYQGNHSRHALDSTPADREYDALGQLWHNTESIVQGQLTFYDEAGQILESRQIGAGSLYSDYYTYLGR